MYNTDLKKTTGSTHFVLADCELKWVLSTKVFVCTGAHVHTKFILKRSYQSAL